MSKSCGQDLLKNGALLGLGFLRQAMRKKDAIEERKRSRRINVERDAFISGLEGHCYFYLIKQG